MIVDAIVTLLFGLLEGIAALLPTWELPGSLQSSGNALGAAAAGANAFFPVSVLGACLLAVIAFEVAIQTTAAVVWLWGLIPFKAS